MNIQQTERQLNQNQFNDPQQYTNYLLNNQINK